MHYPLTDIKKFGKMYMSVSPLFMHRKTEEQILVKFQTEVSPCQISMTCRYFCYLQERPLLLKTSINYTSAGGAEGKAMNWLPFFEYIGADITLLQLVQWPILKKITYFLWCLKLVKIMLHIKVQKLFRSIKLSNNSIILLRLWRTVWPNG